MFIPQKKAVIIRVFALAVLLVLFLLSFVKNNSKDLRKGSKTQFLNTKNKELVSDFQISSGGKTINLHKIKDGFIAVQENTEYPAEEELIAKLMDGLLRQRTVYRLSDSLKENNFYGFNQEEETVLTYTLDDGNSTNLYFGKLNFGENLRYFHTDKNLNVYQVENDLDTYLTASMQFWCQNELICKAFLPENNPDIIQSVQITDENSTKIIKNEELKTFADQLLKLRHGGVISRETFDNISSTQYRLEIELGNKDKITVLIKDKLQNEYYLKITDLKAGSKEKQSFYVKISGWTLNKLLGQQI